MPKEFLIYGTIDAESSSEFIRGFAELESEDEPLSVRVNTPGGSPEYGWGIITKFKEYTGPKIVKVDGKAFSMGMFLCCYADKDKVEAVDTAEFIMHRAAYPDWIERDTEYFNDAMRANLERVNKSLRTAFENRVDVVLFEQLTGKKLKDIFSMDGRLDVSFSAQIAKRIGLISKIISITPAKSAEINNFMLLSVSKTYDIAALTAPKVEETQNNQNSNKNKMTLEELKAQHPEAYAAAVAEGKKAEKDRVESIMVFNHLDSEACKKAIESGESLSAKQMAEFSLKAMSPEALAKLSTEAPAGAATAAAESKEKTAEEKKLEDFEKSVKAELNLTK